MKLEFNDGNRTKIENALQQLNEYHEKNPDEIQEKYEYYHDRAEPKSKGKKDQILIGGYVL